MTNTIFKSPVKRPLLRYHGGKWILSKWIISHFPQHIKYCEPFGGAASVLLQKEPSKIEVYNDLDSEVVNLFKVLQLCPKELIELLKVTPFSRYEFKQSLKTSGSPIESARRLIVRSYMSFSPTAVQQNITPGFRCSKIHYKANPVQAWKNYPAILEAIVERLSSVCIENIDAGKLIKNHDGEQTLFYLDPPYLLATRFKKSKTHVYNFEMSDADHENVLNQVLKIKGKVVISGYDNELYNDMLTGWKIETKETFSDSAKKRVETLWIKK